MSKWKVVVRVVDTSSAGSPNIEINRGVVGMRDGYWLVADRIVSIAGVPYEQIPASVRHKGDYGSKRECVFLRKGITLEDFDVTVLNLPKWKIVVDLNHVGGYRAQRLATTDNVPDVVKQLGLIQYSANQIRVHGMIEVAGVKWENIPNHMKEENPAGYRFLTTRDGITVNDFEVVEL